MLKRNLIIAVIFIAGLFAIETLAQDVSPGSTTQTFNNAAAITINDNANAAPYPSNITVNGVSAFTRMEVRLNGFSHTFPDDVDIILVGPQGQRAVLMSDAGGGNPGVTNQTFTFSQTATTPIPDATLPTTGTFRPANYQNIGGNLIDTFPAPGPGALTDAPADLFVFNGTNPNGIWNLYVVDDVGQDVGSISGGWTLTFTVPQIFTVTKTDDTNDGACNADCSLREALALAQDGDLINFSALFNTPQTINLLTALPDITRSITIQGTGANLLTVRRDFNAATNFRIFNIGFSITNGVAISGMTITGGSANQGGGILSFSHLTLNNVHVTGNTAGSGGGGVSLAFADGVFTGCTFSGNSAAFPGGGINYQGEGGRTLRLINSTVSGNNANEGGGIHNVSFNNGNSRLEVTNSTIANNNATVGGSGGILTAADLAGNTATTTLRNSIIAGNTPNNLATGTSGGGAATVTSQGFNLASDNGGGFLNPPPIITDQINTNPRLAPLALYGGQTPTHALLHSSPAIDAGNSSGSGVDGRGRPRPFDVPFVFPPSVSDNADIGAVEMQASLVVNANAEMQSPFLVTNPNGTPVFLRDAIEQSPPNSDILFGPLFNSPQTITLGGTELLIDKNLNIIGTGANLLTISGGNASRVFQVSSGITATLSGMSIVFGNANGDGGGIFNDGTLTVTHSTVSNSTSQFDGGGIGNGANGILTVSNSTITGNTAIRNGGGINNSIGTVTLNNSTISGNTANFNGGGIYITGTMTINNSTVTNNSVGNAAALPASGILQDGGTVAIRNSIIAGNVGNATKPDVEVDAGTFTSKGFNLIGNPSTVTFNQTGDQFGTGVAPLNPQLGALLSNGGTTNTHALLFGSPALDKGNSSGATSDQRGIGFNRPVDLPTSNATGGDGTDIGAFEQQGLIAETGLEADVASRPNGDGSIFSNDIVQVRRFVNGSNTPDPAINEFQRADSAPFATKGDGSLNSADVVQARRYQNGSNPIQTAGGPTAPIGMFALADEFDEQQLAKGVVRSLRIEKATDGGGQTVTVNLLVDAVGDESEYGFVLNYDASILSSPVIVAGNTGAKARSCHTATAGTINCSVGGFPNDVNTSGIGEITAGDNQILITVTFTLAANAPAETMLPLKLSNVNASNDEATLLKMSGQGVDFIADEQ